MNLFNRKENLQKILNQNNTLKSHLERIFIEQSFPDGTVILDLGCAEIRDYSEFLAQKAGAYYGVDISCSLINLAKEKLKAQSNCHLIQSSIENLNLPDNFFDIIVCNNMLAYTNQVIAINKVFSLLKPEGVCISFYNNTWQYSVYKMFYPFKPFLRELIHSAVVLTNSGFYYLAGLKIFHTIFNIKRNLKKIISRHNLSLLEIITDNNSLPYSVINFIFIK